MSNFKLFQVGETVRSESGDDRAGECSLAGRSSSACDGDAFVATIPFLLLTTIIPDLRPLLVRMSMRKRRTRAAIKTLGSNARTGKAREAAKASVCQLHSRGS